MSGEELPRAVVFSVDLEPNKDGTLAGIRDAMEWFDRTVPRGTVFATYRIATEMPQLLRDLSESHEIGVHVHPREFGYEHDQLAELPPDRQRALIAETRDAIADAIGCSSDDIASFRAGRHSASEATIDVLRELEFDVDASVNVRYNDYLPRSVMQRSEPFDWDGIVEVPVTYGMLPVLSRCGLRRLTTGPLTATASTVRSDSWGCNGLRAASAVVRNVRMASFYMHPYDATTYHDLENSGGEFRDRFEALVSNFTKQSVRVRSILPK